MRAHRQLGQHGMRCSTTSRFARGASGMLIGAGSGAIVGFLLGTALGVRKLADASAEAAPIRTTLLTAFGFTAAGAVAGLTLGALPPEC